MKTLKRSFGDQGEKIAANYLKEASYIILDLNFKNKLGRQLGEIDIIAKDEKKGELVFVEVKTRELSRYQNTLPEENITPAKLKKMARIASAYLRQKNLTQEPYRFDALSIWINEKTKEHQIKHIPCL